MLALSTRLWPSISSGAESASTRRPQRASAPAGWSEPLLHDRELVAADAGEQVVRLEQGLQAFGAGLEDAVAKGMAERVVELAEAVEIETQQRRLLAVVARPGERLLDAARAVRRDWRGRSARREWRGGAPWPAPAPPR